MRHKLLSFIFLLILTQAFSQLRNINLKTVDENTSVLQHKVSILENENQNLKNKLNKLTTDQGMLSSDLKVLERKSDSANSALSKLSDELSSKIQTADTSAKDGIAKMDKNISSSRIFWILGLLATALLGYLLYVLLRKKINSSNSTWEQKLKSDRNALETQIQSTKKSLEEEGVKLDSKLMELLESQQKINNQNITNSVSSLSDHETDHSFALKVADEIVRIQKNIQQMDSSTKGLKQLSASVKRIQENFISQGYEVLEMLGNEYNDGMRVIANFVATDKLPTGKQVITRIIKPQVNFQNKMIQPAQIEVSVGE